MVQEEFVNKILDILSPMPNVTAVKNRGHIVLLCARYFSPPLRQMRSPLYTNFFVLYCHPPF